jgi:hypothetical protein
MKATRIMSVFNEGIGTFHLAIWSHWLRTGNWPEELHVARREDFDMVFRGTPGLRYDPPLSQVHLTVMGQPFTLDCYLNPLRTRPILVHYEAPSL